MAEEEQEETALQKIGEQFRQGKENAEEKLEEYIEERVDEEVKRRARKAAPWVIALGAGALVAWVITHNGKDVPR